MPTLIQLALNFLLFIPLSLFVLYLPGFGIIINKKKLVQDQEILVFSFSLSFVLFVMLAIALAFLNIRWMMLPILITVGLYVLTKYKLGVFRPWKIFIKDKLLLIIIILGILTQGLINFPSGFLYKDGLLFWSSQGHDGIWHISLMEEIKRNLPPANPIFAGENLYNYHYLVDVLMGEFGRIFPIFTSLDLYFRFFPVIFSCIIGISVFAFVSRWRENKKIGYLGIFFTYFAGSFGYIVTFLRNGNLFGGETVFWASQENTLIGNPPQAIAHIFLAAFFLSFLFYLNKRKLYWLVISFLLGSMLTGFKVSGGLVMLTGIGAAAVADLIFNRKMQTFLLALALAITNFITFKAMTSKEAVSFLMFLPWWFIRTMVVDKLGWMDMEFRRQHYISKGTWHAWLRVFQLETTAFMIFLVGNLGMRVLGLFSIVRDVLIGKSYKKPFEIMLMVTMITAFLIPIFFVQKGIIYNNIQFMQYFLFIFGFYGAITVYNLIYLFQNKWIRICIFVLIAMFAIPTVIGNLNEFYGPGRTSLAKISNQDLEALQYLKEHSAQDAIILTMPFNKYLKDKFPYQPRPIYAWYSTAYIPALTSRRIYLTDEEQALITGYPIGARLSKMNTFFDQRDFSFNRKFLKEANINFIYIAKNEIEKPLDIKNNSLSIFFENNEVVIYKVENS